MKFNEIRDMVEKMSGSKLTGQEISVWYKKNPDVKKAVKDKAIKQAVEIALDHGGAMNFAIKKIEKIKRGLADHPAVSKALSFANFGEEKTLEDGAGEHSAAAQYAKDTPGQGIREEKIAILTSVYKSVKREMDTLMKKHDAYVSDTSRAGTTISSSKPLGAFIKDVQKLIGLKEETEIFFEAFTRKKELVAVAKMDKMLEQSYKAMNKLYGMGNSKAMIEVNDGIVKARRGLDTYVDEIKAGKID